MPGAVGLVGGGSIGAPVPAAAFSHEDQDQLLAFFDKYNVSLADRAVLLRKLAQGEPWLALIPGSVPTAVENRIDSDMNVTINRYQDGSVAVLQTSVPGEQDVSDVSPQAVYNCEQASSSPYHAVWEQCVADVNLGVVRMYFTFNYQFVTGKGYKITRYYNYGHHVIGGALSDFRFSQISNTDVRLSADLSGAFKGFPLGWTAYMGVRIEGGLPRPITIEMHG